MAMVCTLLVTLGGCAQNTNAENGNGEKPVLMVGCDDYAPFSPRPSRKRSSEAMTERFRSLGRCFRYRNGICSLSC